jgi:hypothetical protein
MAGIKYQVELRETNTEFLLFIHASQKERAKEIEGRRWDTERRCWVYPKTPRVYDAIIAEFGDDMASSSIKRPTLPSVSAQTAALQVKIRIFSGPPPHTYRRCGRRKRAVAVSGARSTHARHLSLGRARPAAPYGCQGRRRDGLLSCRRPALGIPSLACTDKMAIALPVVAPMIRTTCA